MEDLNIKAFTAELVNLIAKYQMREAILIFTTDNLRTGILNCRPEIPGLSEKFQLYFGLIEVMMERVEKGEPDVLALQRIIIDNNQNTDGTH